jgi:hypothetical protein
MVNPVLGWQAAYKASEKFRMFVPVNAFVKLKEPEALSTLGHTLYSVTEECENCTIFWRSTLTTATETEQAGCTNSWLRGTQNHKSASTVGIGLQKLRKLFDTKSCAPRYDAVLA